MKHHIHFFGCSQTAGDELSDEKWFPWKQQVHTAEEYYRRRDNFFENNWNEYLKYLSDNKKSAYPALIETDKLRTYNHARNGHSLRTCVLDALMLINSDTPVDMIIFQIPPVGRELFIDKSGDAQSIQATILNERSSWYEYLRTRVLTHDHRQYAVEDIMDMIMFNGYVQNSGIPFMFIELSGEMDYRIADVSSLSKYEALLRGLSTISITKLQDKLLGTELLGHHFSSKGHEIIAAFLTNEILQTLNIK